MPQLLKRLIIILFSREQRERITKDCLEFLDKCSLRSQLPKKLIIILFRREQRERITKDCLELFKLTNLLVVFAIAKELIIILFSRERITKDCFELFI